MPRLSRHRCLLIPEPDDLQCLPRQINGTSLELPDLRLQCLGPLLRLIQFHIHQIGLLTLRKPNLHRITYLLGRTEIPDIEQLTNFFNKIVQYIRLQRRQPVQNSDIIALLFSPGHVIDKFFLQQILPEQLRIVFQ